MQKFSKSLHGQRLQSSSNVSTGASHAGLIKAIKQSLEFKSSKVQNKKEKKKPDTSSIEVQREFSVPC